MDVLGDYFLSATCLPNDHHGCVGRRGATSQLGGGLEGAGRSKKHIAVRTCRKWIAGWRFIRATTADGVSGSTKQQLELGARIRFGQVVPGANPHRFDV